MARQSSDREIAASDSLASGANSPPPARGSHPVSQFQNPIMPAPFSQKLTVESPGYPDEFSQPARYPPCGRNRQAILADASFRSEPAAMWQSTHFRMAASAFT